MKKITMLLWGICSLLKANAQVTQVVNMNTGIVGATNSSTTLIALAANEDTWSLVSPSGLTPKCAQLGAWTNDPAVRWISPYVNSSGTAQPNGVSGYYIYKMTFTAKSCDVISAKIHFNALGGDNSVSTVSVESDVHFFSAGFSGTLTSGDITIDPAAITPGAVNSITISVHNNVNDYFTGLLVDGSLTVNYGDTTLVPSFTGSSSFCAGAPLTFNGSASTGSISDYVWLIAECDASGYVAPSTPVWWSPFYAGSPGSFTFPTGTGAPTIQCGKYYFVTLALQNTCNVWAPTGKVIYINCPPPVNAGPDDTLCSGSCVTIGTAPVRGNTYHWYTSAGSAGTSGQITVCPTTTTTYTLTMTNNLTGCSASDVVTIHVAPYISAYFTGPSSFCYGDALTFNTAGSIGGANDYVWTVVECTSAGVPVSGGLAWWSPFYPGMPGIYTIPTAAAGGPAVTCGKYYEIKLALQNDCNVWAPYTKIIYIGCAPCNGGALTAHTPSSYKNLSADGSSMDAAVEFNIYPNPSNGVFTIESTTSDKTIMEVYDMLGNKVKSVEMIGHYTLDLTGYSKGIYMIKMTVNGQQINKKIILE